MAKEIHLTNGGIAIVDDEDYEELSRWNWQRSHKNYAIRTNRVNARKFTLSMHRVIAKTPDGLQTDHINRNRLDNRRCNLRNVTSSQNSLNRSFSKLNTSGVTGVSWKKQCRKWVAKTTHECKPIHLGYFDNIQDAEAAYKSYVGPLIPSASGLP